MAEAFEEGQGLHRAVKSVESVVVVVVAVAVAAWAATPTPKLRLFMHRLVKLFTFTEA
jgi:hypothetical protein